MRIVGMVSGTSLDGVTMVVADVTRTKRKVVEVAEVAYGRPLRERLLAISNTTAHTGEVSRLNFLLGEQWAAALGKLRTPLASIDAIALSGQTIFHERKSTLQIGEATVVAERTGKPVVSNFRTRDVAAGGQGAPLVPFADLQLFGHRTRNRVALNLGGIGNVTLLPAGCRPEGVIGFDTGPGNMVIDQLTVIATEGKQSYDRHAMLARKGHVQKALLQQLLREPYLRAKPPKTCGREQYGKEFIGQLLASGHSLPDLLATATVYTAATVVEAIRRFFPGKVDDLIVAGGGAKNPMIMDHLRGFLPGTTVMPSDAVGVPSEAREGLAFAMIAYATWHGQTGNLPSVTGARRPVILGQITKA